MMDGEKSRKRLKEKIRREKARHAAEIRRENASHAAKILRLGKKSQAKLLELIRGIQRLEPGLEDTSDQAYDPTRDHYYAPPPKVPRRLIDPGQRRPSLPPRLPHNKYDRQKVNKFVEDFMHRRGMNAAGALIESARIILWAWAGRTNKARAVRLGIIAGSPVAEIARRSGVRKQDVYKHMKTLGERSIITAGIAENFFPGEY
jgi:hypothetical protein